MWERVKTEQRADTEGYVLNWSSLRWIFREFMPAFNHRLRAPKASRACRIRARKLEACTSLLRGCYELVRFSRALFSKEGKKGREEGDRVVTVSILGRRGKITFTDPFIYIPRLFLLRSTFRCLRDSFIAREFTSREVSFKIYPPRVNLYALRHNKAYQFRDKLRDLVSRFLYIPFEIVFYCTRNEKTHIVK